MKVCDLVARLRNQRRDWLDVEYVKRAMEISTGQHESTDVKMRVRDKQIDVWLNGEHYRGWREETHNDAVAAASKLLRELMEQV